LFRPLAFLLAEGGDLRLAIDRATKLNTYGCRTHPDADTLAFSSSTATCISQPAYWRAQQARDELVAHAIQDGIIDAFDAQCERMRDFLRSCLDLPGGDIVFSPSGTDSQLQVHLLAGLLLDGPITTIVLGADQTGSGTALTARGQHFSNRTAQGNSVIKGNPITGRDAVSIGISLFAEDGAVRSASEIDAAVIDAVTQQTQAGRKILLQTMDSSKLGWRAPSDACLREVRARWPHSVEIVVDACQMRITRQRLREYLDRDCIVLLTGSKFFSGPAFSGASLWPRTLSAHIAAKNAVPFGLSDYATRFDLPLHWTGIRAGLPSVPNYGQWLRWEAALEEMRAYYALPDSWRRTALAQLSDAVRSAIDSSPNLEFLARNDGRDADMPATIFPFFVKTGGRALNLEEVTQIYRALNRNLALPATATQGEQALASTLCHIGQPVQLAAGTVLRIAIGARTISQAWSQDAQSSESNLHAIAGQIRTIVKKIELILSTNTELENPL
jgi:hypothetical protein